MDIEVLLHRHALSKIPWLVDIAASADGYVVGGELEGDYFQDGEEEFVGLGDVDGVFYQLRDVGVAFNGDGAGGWPTQGFLLL